MTFGHPEVIMSLMNATAITTHTNGTVHSTSLKVDGLAAVRAAKRASRGTGIAKVVVTTGRGTVRTFVAGRAA